jgi:hypothetical protein
MKIEYLHASKFRELMAAKGVGVEVHHIRDVKLPGTATRHTPNTSSNGRSSRSSELRLLAQVPR